MASPTKAEWEKIKSDLSTPYGRAFFNCEGYLIAAIIEQDKMKLIIAVHVNGWIRGKWFWHGKEQDIDQMPEIARRFYCLKTKRPPAKRVAQDIKIFGKKRCLERGLHAAFCTALPWFNTPGSFIAHLKKHNPSIEVIDFNTYQAAQKALIPDEDNTVPAGTAGADCV